jgi:DNA-directed RNA polymerase, mitochondrial
MDETARRTAEGFRKEQEHRIRSLGLGGTVQGLHLIRLHIDKLAKAIEQWLAVPAKLSPRQRKFGATMRRLKPRDIAEVTLWAFITAIGARPGKESDASDIKIRVGEEIRIALDFDYMRRGKPGRGGNKAMPGTYALIQRETAQESTLKGKRRVAKRLARGFRWSPSTREADLRTGIWLWAVCLRTLTDLFMEETEVYYDHRGRPHKVRVPAICPEAIDLAVAIAMEHMRRHPVFSLSDEPPRDWTGYRNGGYWTARSKYAATFVRNVHHAEDVEMFKKAMRREMRPHMAGVSALQSVDWSINWRIVDVLDKIEDLGLLDRLLGEPTGKDGRTRARQKANNLTRLRVAIAEARPQWSFYTAKTCDTRGRVYSTMHFGFEREDHVRALHLFAFSKPVEGLYWLKIHLANCGDFGKISKRPFAERVRWVDSNLDQILACASQPIANCYWWKEAAEPLMFLAAAFELAGALEAIQEGRTFYSRLPIAFDGTCSGFQHLALMARCEKTARLVNLIPSDEPQDIYQEVADCVKARLEAANDPIAKVCLDWDIDRKLLKPSVMTFPYSVSDSGMRDQLREGLKERGKKYDREAVKYLIGCLKAAIRDLAPGAVEVQKFLRGLAGVMAKVGLSVCWTSPTGFPCINRAQKPLEKVIDVTLPQAGLRWQHTLAGGFEDSISEALARNRISPNVTHSMDASHLIRVANACKAKDVFQFGMIHDAFHCLAPDAPALRKIILEELVGMYGRHNVLAEIRARAENDIKNNPEAAAIFKKRRYNKKGKELPPLKLPDVPKPGDLDLNVILKAEYAFN